MNENKDDLKGKNNFMQIEYEATFPNIDKNEIREKLKNVGATLVRPEFLQKISCWAGKYRD